MHISLHHLAVTETTPAEFAEIAAALRCDHICLFVKIPPAQESAFPYVFPRVRSVGAAHELRTRLERLGLSVWRRIRPWRLHGRRGRSRGSGGDAHSRI